MDNKTILVTGATGQQGGAVAKHLLKDSWIVRALVRDPNKDKAQALQEQGVELAQGDLTDRTSLQNAVEGVYGIFSVQNFWLPEVGFDGEIQQGKLLADVAKEAGTQHFVYSSVGAAERGEGQKHFESKWLIEQYLKEIGLPHTILRPVAFMDNLNWSRPQISNGVLPSRGVRADKKNQLIAVDDIGAIASIAFSNPDEYLGQTIEIAGDELTEAEQAEVLSTVTGRPVKLTIQEMPEGIPPDEELLAGDRFFNGKAYTADIAAIRKMHPNLQALEDFLRANGWTDLAVLPIPENSNPY